MSRYAIKGPRSGELLTYGGAVIVHNDRAEMEFLLPGAQIVPIASGDLGQPVLRLQDHPDCQHMEFPLDRRDFPR